MTAGRSRSIAAFLFAAGFALGGCALGGDPDSPLSIPAPPPARAMQDPAQARERARIVAAFGGVYRAAALDRTLAEIVARLARASTDIGGEATAEASFRVTVLDSATVNAFALPGGDLFVTRGLVTLANDTSEIAAVLAHEMAHVTARHAVARAELETRSALVSRVTAEVLGDAQGGQVVRTRDRVAIAGFSRAQELEADAVGIRTLAAARFDPYGAVRFLDSLARQAALGATDGDRNAPDLLATHPATPDRRAKALTAARTIGAPGFGEANRERWLAALDGVRFGEAGGEVSVRGRRIMHGKLALSFVAPPGFTLERTAGGVVGVAPGGLALRLDSVERVGGQSIDGSLSPSWIDGVELGPTEVLTIGGRDAATALGRGRDWTFRFTAIEAGGSIARVIFAARHWTDDTDASFRAALTAARPPTADDLRELRLDRYVAKLGDTASTLASLMSRDLDRPGELALLINGLEKGGALETGRPYKIVVDERR